MRGLVCCAITMSCVLCAPAALARKAKPIRVQLYGDLFQVDEESPESVSRRAFLILPDGSHAEALCLDRPPNNICGIEPFAVEKRTKIPCDLLRDQPSEHATCYKSEMYEAERRNNDITLHTANGKVTYHIVGSW